MGKCLGLFLILFQTVAFAEPGDLLKLDERRLAEANSCIFQSPFWAGSPFTVYCNGSLAIEVEGMAGGFNKSRMGREKVVAVSKIVSEMIGRGFSILLAPGTSPNVVDLDSFVFIKNR